jgi:DNA-binding GntR family transcriptional regulator
MQIRRETLGAQVYNLLRDRILRGEVAGDTRLAQEPLSIEIGISRIPIRDALKRLESDGLIVCDEIGRYTVVPFRVQDADEIYAIRRRLEPFAVELAVQAMTSEAMSDIEALFADLSKAARRRQLESYIDLNVKFHMAIYEASGMGRLVSIIRRLYVGVPPLTPIMLEGRLGRSQKEHEEIMRRLVARDQSGAAAAMDRHIGNAGAELRKTMAAGTKLRRDTSTRRRSKNDHG